MLQGIKNFTLDYLVADVPPLSSAERWRSTLAALVGLLVATALAWFLPIPFGERWLIAPIGASAVILFAAPHSPMAQPWSVIGGYLVATLVASLCIAALPEYPPVAAVLAVAGSIGLMAWLRCLHPPGGALAFVVVYGHGGSLAQALQTMLEVGLDAAYLMLAALIANNLLFRRRYPHCRERAPLNPHRTPDALPTERVGLDHTDLSAAMQKLDTFLDIQEADLVRIYQHAVDHAFERHLGLRCADVMARNVVTVEFATELQEAWSLLRAHKLRALPVVDRHNGQLLGMVTVADFLKQIDQSRIAALAGKVANFLKPTPGPVSDKPEVVGQIMSSKPFAVTADLSIVELVHQLSDAGLHHVPVIDERRRVLGMVTQSDLIAALYKQVALAQSSGKPISPAAAPG